MSSSVVLSLTDIGKRYSLNPNPFRQVWQLLLPSRSEESAPHAHRSGESFWALKNVSLEVPRGASIAIIGENGSGKSTLLQIITGTLTPTTGTVGRTGVIGSLLELGAGFNPEFTGRQNATLNAQLMGLSPEKISERMPDILRFAELGAFIDQPVKTYSSGMYVRLAFSVIAHIDADILVIDEALAVGDAAFTQKCMQFIRAFKERGTFILVSHDLNAVQALCDRTIWLKQGEIAADGSSKEVIERYLHHFFQASVGSTTHLVPLKDQRLDDTSDDQSDLASDLTVASEVTGMSLQAESNLDRSSGWKTESGEITEISLVNVDDPSAQAFRGGEKVRLLLRAQLYADFNSPILGFLFRDRFGQDLFGENTLCQRKENAVYACAGQRIHAEFEFRLPLLPNGDYFVMASLANGDLKDHVQHHWLNDALLVKVQSSTVRWGLMGIPFERVSFNVQSV
jgi:lipopolysaccharide transport system ATP-binding protein